MIMPASLQPPQPPPFDVANQLLAPVGVRMNLERHDFEGPDVEDVPAIASSVPAEVEIPGSGRTKVVALTIRTPCQTFSAFWDLDTTRENIGWIRRFLAEEMPLVILPPGATSAPDLRRMVLTLEHEATGSCVEVTLNAEHAATWADLLERALLAHTGLAIPGQGQQS